ncbi:MAG TPA: epoxide hydrolase [Thermomicrobiales bacterium]|nr:epoxide hydrolase [Thermomicrobiales bacterium]
MQPEPLTVTIPQDCLDDLRRRLTGARWMQEIPDAGWDYGTNAGFLRTLIDYWRDGYDWRATESFINTFNNQRVDIDGMGIHFIHERGTGPNPLPILLSHGWPSTFYEMLRLLPLLTNPASHGGDPGDAFDVVVPSIPGYPFSDQPATRGFHYGHVAEQWVALMEGLGYPRFGVHTYDVGRSVMSMLLRTDAQRIIGYHTSEPGNPSPNLGPGSAPLTEAERAYMEAQRRWQAQEGGYMALQTTRPHSLGYGLTDSPLGLAAWVIEKWFAWTEPPSGNLLDSFSMDDLLATLTLYWATGTINSANRLYFERARSAVPLGPDERIAVPYGVTRSTQAIERVPREHVERVFTNLRHWADFERGGHFVALEEPELVATAIRDFFRPLRS